MIFKEFTLTKNGIITDCLRIVFNSDEVVITIKGNYYLKQYNKIKNLNKEQIIEFYKTKHTFNFTEAC